MNLFEHEVRIAAFFRRFNVPINVNGLERAFVAEMVVYAYAAPGQHGDFAFIEQLHRPRVANQRWNVAADVLCAVGQPDDKRRILARAVERIRRFSVQNAQCVAAFEHCLRAQNGREHVAVVKRMQQMGDYLRVCFGYEHAALRLQLSAQLLVVLDDAVVDDCDMPFHVRVRMGVDVVWFAVGCPARVTDADGAGQGIRCHPRGKVRQPSLRLAQPNDAAVHDRNARAVIAAVLQSGKSVQ